MLHYLCIIEMLALQFLIMTAQKENLLFVAVKERYEIIQIQKVKNKNNSNTESKKQIKEHLLCVSKQFEQQFSQEMQ
jgi:hypothetical protein